jgi:hypothetical protein
MPDSDLFLFVSHVREDRQAALEVVDELERRGVACWIAPRDVHPGKSFDDEIAEAIETSRAMLLIFSDRCNDHEYIRREVTVAGESRKVIIPFRIENAHPARGLRVRLSDLHWIDGFVSRERAIDQVVRAIDPDRARRHEEERRRVEERQRADEQRRTREEEQHRHEQEGEQRRQQQEEQRLRPEKAERIKAEADKTEAKMVELEAKPAEGGETIGPPARVSRRVVIAGAGVVVAGAAIWAVQHARLRMTTLVVITDAGNVYGADVNFNNNTLGPVYEFNGAKIGYNYPQDRFMMQQNNTLLVTNNGNVYAAQVDVANQRVNPVYQPKAARIGYNSQDRFMVATAGSMFVITNTGDVYCETTNGGPVSQLNGAKIGYNPQDWSMVGIGNRLAVITREGNVYASVIKFASGGFGGVPQSLEPVYQLNGAKIGYNPQDRFMVATAVTTVGNTLFVITNTGDVYGSVIDAAVQNVGPVIHFTGAKIGYNPQDKWMVAVEPLPIIL